MSHHECLNVREGSVAPPIPARNPLRDAPHYQVRRGQSSASYGNSTVPSSPTAQILLDEIDRELLETHERFVSAIYMSQVEVENTSHTNKLEQNMPGVPSRTSSLRSRFILGARLGKVEEDKSQASTSSSPTDGLKRYSASLGLGTLPADFGSRRSSQAYEKNATSNPPDKCNDVESTSTISSYDGAPEAEIIDEEEEQEIASVEAWLQRGSFSAPPPEPDRFSQSSKARSSTSEKKRPNALQIFPPVSPSSGKREYASPLTSPLSPLGNGRDAYGNFIPTNPQDYFVMQSPPTSPSLQPIMEDTVLKTGGSTPQLRGGGNWWHTLGIGSADKEPSLESKTISIRSGSRQSSRPVHQLKDEYSVASRDVGKQSPKATGEVAQAGPASSILASVAMNRSSVIIDEWSDELDEAHLEAQIHNLEQRNIFTASPTVGQFGSVKDRRSRIPRQPAPRAPLFHLPPTDSSRNESTAHPGSGCQNTAPHPKSSVPSLSDLWSNVSSTKFSNHDAGRPETPTSQVSYEPRSERRWDAGPNTRPPKGDALPPPPPSKHLRSNVSTTPRQDAQYMHPQHNQPIPEHIYTSPSDINRASSPPHTINNAFDLESLAFGDSVSAYRGTMHYRPNPSELAAVRDQAQHQFHILCHNLMTGYNAEAADIQRRLQAGAINQDQADTQHRFNIGNKANSLRVIMRETGYQIIPFDDEAGILTAMNSPEGYAIYHDLLSTIKPSLWRKLNAQHHNVQNHSNTPSPSVSISIKSRESSLDQARHVAGKIARFVLAAPSDPDLKTYSSRQAVLFSPMGVPIMAGGKGTGAQVWGVKEKDKKDKGKEKLVGLVVGDGVGRQDVVAGAGPVGLVSPAAVHGDERHIGASNPSQTQTFLVTDRDPQSHAPSTVSDGASLVQTDVSIWPVNDTEGNWYDARRIGNVIMRGGAGKKKKREKVKKEKKEKRADVRVK
ncbi:hypothetical protein EK21DRAFT_107091 [Setomelanomma holmii]|uniref:Uncharacterized protein n=1 Tax=Setomelanomma holmii TaxID=210430 RepID=A0A9P4HL74_9PLEO|nr:hypothetical protein EK21DRAFT_107091 [Setomelanomma holmii]